MACGYWIKMDFKKSEPVLGPCTRLQWESLDSPVSVSQQWQLGETYIYLFSKQRLSLVSDEGCKSKMHSVLALANMFHILMWAMSPI